MNFITPSLIKIGLGVALGLLLFIVVTVSALTISAAGGLPNGVAAGDTTQTSTILWARGATTGPMLFEYSTSSTFSSDVLAKNAAITDVLQPVKVQLTGLSPAATYFYRVTDAAGASETGHFRTASPTGTRAGLRFGVSGDWKGELAPYPSIANADTRNLDFFVEHGDTIAAGGAITTTAAYRLKHNEVYSTHLGLNTWADLRSSTSILATIDDNEVRNDFAGGVDPSDPSVDPDFDKTGAFVNETQLYGNALRAFQAYNPLRDEFYGDTGGARTANKRKLYRFNTYGSDAALFLLDTRSFRDKQLDRPTNEVEALQFLNDSFDPNRTLLGAQQLADLKADLQQAQDNGITWKFILVPSPIQNLGLPKAEDRYEGYAAERAELLRFIHQNEIENVVFIAAGLHGTLINNLTYQEAAFGPHTAVKTFEVIVGPVAVAPPEGPFGPVVIDIADVNNLITAEEKADYENRSRAGKDQFVKDLINDELITPFPFNYDPLGLDGSDIEATLLQGDYVSLHTYGWTEFDISRKTQVLTVTTYGIDFYTENELDTTPNEVINRTPTIVSQFMVTPTLKESIYLPVIVKPQ